MYDRLQRAVLTGEISSLRIASPRIFHETPENQPSDEHGTKWRPLFRRVIHSVSRPNRGPKMKLRKREIKMSVFLLTWVLLFGCDYTKEETNHTAINEKNDAIPDSQKRFASEMLERLRSGHEISPLLSDNIIFIFHSDNRCDGSTDGLISDLPSRSIDLPFKIHVTNDGDGWECEKKEASTHEIEFSLRKQLTHWDRFEIGEYDKKANSIYFNGGGESDSMIIYFKKENDRDVVYKIEYRSEDPG